MINHKVLNGLGSDSDIPVSSVQSWLEATLEALKLNLGWQSGQLFNKNENSWVQPLKLPAAPEEEARS